MNKNEIRELTKNMILKTEKVNVDPLGDLYIREMSARTYTKLSGLVTEGTEYDQEKFLIYAMIASTLDVNGEQIWDYSDYEEVANLPADIFTAITTVVMKINNISGATNKAKN